ncbi:MAG TPA: hypothetical protein VEZ48_01495 [Sphingomonadaceae bacterium]|nr:hypothetical protein [Sphingomonadaceae bacterium]
MSLLLPLFVLLAATAQQPGPPSPGFEPRRAPSQARPCLTPPEAKALATFVLPGLVEGLAKRCERSLPANAYLRAPEARALAQRLRRDAAPSWPAARLAIEKLNGSRLPSFLGDRFLMNVAEGTASDLVLQDFDRKDCGAVDGLVAGLAPLPSGNFSDVIAALIALGGDGAAAADAPLRICPTAASPR